MRVSRNRIAVCIAFCFAVPTCSRVSTDLVNRPCDEGDCVDLYTCHPQLDICVVEISTDCADSRGACAATILAGDPCFYEGSFLPCVEGGVGCEESCRTCLPNGEWSDCRIGDCTADADGDGLVDCEDNCPQNANADQRDRDGDGQGDLCDTFDCGTGRPFCDGLLHLTCGEDGLIIQEIDCDDDQECTIDSCDAAVGCEHLPVSESTPCAGSNADLCDSTCNSSGQCVSIPVDCDDNQECTIDSCLAGVCQHGAEIDGRECGLRSCAGTELMKETCLAGLCNGTGLVGDCDDGLVCNGAESCTPTGCVGGTQIQCDDSCACSVDACVEQPFGCDADFSSCSSFSISAPLSAPKGSAVTISIDANCLSAQSAITCVSSPVRFGVNAMQTFEGTLHGWQTSRGTVTNVECNADAGVIPTAGCQDLDGGVGDVMRLAQDSRARAGTAINASIFSNLVLHLRAAISFETECSDNGFGVPCGNGDLEYIGVRACCGTGPGCATEVGRVFSAEDGGRDGWGNRPCTATTCAGAGYSLGVGFDGCGAVWLELDWNSSAWNEMVHVDNIWLSGERPLTLIVSDSGFGLQASITAPFAQNVRVTCTWVDPPGSKVSSTDINFY